MLVIRAGIKMLVKITNREDPDHRSSLIWVCPVCQDIFVANWCSIFRSFTISWIFTVLKMAILYAMIFSAFVFFVCFYFDLN